MNLSDLLNFDLDFSTSRAYTRDMKDPKQLTEEKYELTEDIKEFHRARIEKMTEAQRSLIKTDLLKYLESN